MQVFNIHNPKNEKPAIQGILLCPANFLKTFTDF